MESSFKENVENGKQIVKSELKDELATKGDIAGIKEELLLTKEVFKKDMDNLESRLRVEMKLLDFKLNVIIALATLALSFFNPNFLNFLVKVFKL